LLRLGANHRLAWVLLFCMAVTGAHAQLQDAEEDAFKLARNLFRDAGDYATAAELFSEFIRNYPDSRHLAETRLMLARSFGRSGRCAQALTAYETFYQEHIGHLETASARRERAACLTALGQHLEAARAYEEVCRRFPASEFAPRVLLEAGINYTQADRGEQAAAVYARVVQEYAATSEAHAARFRLALLRFANGKVDAAQLLLAQISAPDPPVAEAPGALLMAGRIELFVGQPDAAAADFQRLQQRFPDSAQADSAYLAQADYLFHRRQYVQAGDLYDAALTQMGAPELRQQALLSLADARRLSRQTEQALVHYRILLGQLAEDHPLQSRARLGLAIAQGQAGHFAAAVGMLQGVMRSAPDSDAAHEALRELGALYSSHGNQLLAINWYRRYLRGVDAAPDQDQVRFTLAGIYAVTGDHEAAIELYRALAETKGPWAADAQFALAQSCEAAGSRHAAMREYVVLLERFPASRYAAGARERVEYLREFSVMDPESLSRALQQAWLEELSGKSRQHVQLDVARALFAHHDFVHAVRAFEHYAAAYRTGPYSAEAQLRLAESLLRLARQRLLEASPHQADSLRELARQEFRILAHAEEDGEWSQRAALQLLQLEAGAAPDSAALVTLVKGLQGFLGKFPAGPLTDLALLRQGDGYRSLAVHDSLHARAAVSAYTQLLSDHPASPFIPDALFGEALARVRLGEMDAAEIILTRILREYPSSAVSPQVLFELGQLLLEQGRHAEAVTRFDELRWAYPTFRQRRAAQQLLADIHVMLGEFDDAVSLYRQLIDGQPQTPATLRLRQLLAATYHRSGQLQAALQTYRDVASQAALGGAAASQVSLDSVYFAQAVLLEGLGRAEEATSQFLRVHDEYGRSPLAPGAAVRAAALMFGRGRYRDAYALYQPYLGQVDDPEVVGRAVLALFRMERTEEAREAASDFARRFGRESAWNQRFRLEEGHLLLRGEQYGRALKTFQEVAEGDGEWADDGAYSMALTRWEENAAEPGPEATARALEAQARFIAQHPNSPYAADVHLRLGNYHYALRNYLQAAGEYRHVLDMAAKPPMAEDAIWRLLSCYQSVHEYDEAHRVAERLLREFPEHPQARAAELEIGVILKEKGQYARAIAQLEKALEWAQGNQASEARYYIGESYQNMGEYRRAIEAYYRVSYHGADGFSLWITSADYRRAQCHESLGEYAPAVAVYDRIVQREGVASPQGRLAAERVAALRSNLE
jgi:TolA-binding protein